MTLLQTSAVRVGADPQAEPHTLTRPELERYAAATGDRIRLVEGRASMPPLYGFCLAFDAMAAALSSIIGDVPGVGIVHLSEVNRRFASALVGDELRASVGVRQVATLPGQRSVATLVTEIHRTQELLVSMESRILLMGISVDQGAPARHERPRPALTSGRVVSALTTFSHDQATRYAEASGDRNPIHLDEESARAAGFGGVILQGMCVLASAWAAAVECLADGDDVRVDSISARFVRPVRPGDTIRTDFRAIGSEDEANSYAMETFGPAGIVIKGGRVTIDRANRGATKAAQK